MNRLRQCDIYHNWILCSLKKENTIICHMMDGTGRRGKWNKSVTETQKDNYRQIFHDPYIWGI